MGEVLVVMEQLSNPNSVKTEQLAALVLGCAPSGKAPEMVDSSLSSTMAENDKVVVDVDEEELNVEAPLIRTGECRICQEEDSYSNLESPCACNGSLKFAHRKCVQYWCNEKGDIICEICHQPFRPGYTSAPRSSYQTSIDIGPLNTNDPRLLALAETERPLLEADYNDANGTNFSAAAFCRSAALILMALLLFRHAVSISGHENAAGDGDDKDVSTFFSLFIFRAVGFLLPCYIMIWAISILQSRRQTQEVSALAAARFSIVVQSAHPQPERS